MRSQAKKNIAGKNVRIWNIFYFIFGDKKKTFACVKQLFFSFIIFFLTQFFLFFLLFHTFNKLITREKKILLCVCVSTDLKINFSFSYFDG